MVRCGLPSWKSNLKLIITLPEQHYNNPDHTRQLCPQIGSMPVEDVPFGLGWVWPATLPHLYKPLGLIAGPLPHHQETFCLSTKLRPSRHFPLASGAGSPQQLQNNITSLYDLWCSHMTTSCASTFHVDSDWLFTYPSQAVYMKLCMLKPWHSREPFPSHCCRRCYPGTTPTQIAISPSSHLRLRYFWVFYNPHAISYA
jgi:hypothetical protein